MHSPRLLPISRLALCLLPLLICSAPTSAEESTTHVFKTEICEADLRAHLDVLAADEMRGRESLSPEGLRAAEYIAAQMERAGVTPHGTDGSWFQPYVIRQPVLKDGNLLEVTVAEETTAFAVEKDWNPFSVCPETEVEAPVVFAGYGIQAPRRQWDDYAGVDVKDKIVLIFRKNPGWREQRHAAFRRKLQVAAAAGAKAVLLCNDPNTTQAAKRDQIGHWSAAIGVPKGSAVIPYAFISQKVARRLLQPTGKTLEALESALRQDGPQTTELEGVSVKLNTALTHTTEANTRNVVGLLPGRDPDLAQEVIVLGAHYDHVGLGNYGSLGGRSAAGKIHNGADDNGSGSVSMLELIAWFGEPKHRPRRSILFIAFSGEERGLLGSRHYADHPTVPLGDITCMLNMDMVGRAKDGQIQIGGVGTAAGLQKIVAEQNKHWKLRVEWDQQGTAPSDSTSFFRKRIPVLFFFTGLHKDYHRPTDDVEGINFKDMNRIVHLVRDVTTALGDADDPLTFTMPPRPPRAPFFGVQPSQESHADGLLVSGVTPSGPAAAAGMQGGDVIVTLAGQVVRDLQTLRGVLVKLKAGKTVKVVVKRGTEQVTLSVTLAERPRSRR